MVFYQTVIIKSSQDFFLQTSRIWEHLFSGDSYIMEHSTGVYISDPKGKLRLHVSSDTNIDTISHDVLELLRTS